MVYRTDSSDLSTVTLNHMLWYVLLQPVGLTILTPLARFGSGRSTNSSVICKTSFVSPCFQCLATGFPGDLGELMS